MKEWLTVFYSLKLDRLTSAEALQKAFPELIKNKTNNMHEPYFRANFTLNGDFRRANSFS